METTRWRGAPCRSGLVRKRRYLPGCNLQAVHMHFWWHLDAPGSNCVNEGFQKLSPTSGSLGVSCFLPVQESTKTPLHRCPPRGPLSFPSSLIPFVRRAHFPTY